MRTCRTCRRKSGNIAAGKPVAEREGPVRDLGTFDRESRSSEIGVYLRRQSTVRKEHKDFL
jgi:hypothetical protein